MAIGSLSAASAYLSQSYRSAQSDMATALARLGSNQRFQTASQDADSYATVAALRGDQGTYDTAFSSSNEVAGEMEVYDAWATQMMDLLVEMKDAVAAGDTATSDGLALAIADLNAATHNGAAITGGAASTMTGLDGVATTISVTGIAITGTTASVDADISALTTFAQEVGASKVQAESLSAAASALSSTNRVAIEQIYKIDEAQEMAKYTAADIKQQASLAMLSQANTSSQAILTLFR